jgi:hypothetical protein
MEAAATSFSLQESAQAWGNYLALPNDANYTRMRNTLAKILPLDVGEDLLTKSAADPLPIDMLYYYWDAFGKICKTFWQSQNLVKENSEFSTLGMVSGHFDSPLTANIIAEVGRSPTVPYAVSDTAYSVPEPESPGYPETPPSQEKKYNEIFIFRKPTPAALNALTEAIESIRDRIEAELNSYFRVIQVRYWEVKPGGEGVGTNAWHTDGFPRHMCKILSFFSDYDSELGTTQFKLLNQTHVVPSGKAGGWFLFQNSTVEHCGLPPKREGAVRKTFEVILGPSFVTSCKAIFAGSNGHYPHRPWYVLP